MINRAKWVSRGIVVHQDQRGGIARERPFDDSNGKVIWVSDGYVAQALLPQIPVSFAGDVPPDSAKNVQTYRVVVNHYDTNSQS